jgi:hypothetical protein
LKRDEGCTAVIENISEVAGSHQVKRYFKAFSWVCGGVFRRILKRLFIWRLRMERLEKKELTIDLMIMDNDEAEKRPGVKPTYKKVKRFGLFHMIY